MEQTIPARISHGLLGTGRMVLDHAISQTRLTTRDHPGGRQATEQSTTMWEIDLQNILMTYQDLNLGKPEDVILVKTWLVQDLPNTRVKLLYTERTTIQYMNQKEQAKVSFFKGQHYTRTGLNMTLNDRSTTQQVQQPWFSSPKWRWHDFIANRSLSFITILPTINTTVLAKGSY